MSPDIPSPDSWLVLFVDWELVWEKSELLFLLLQLLRISSLLLGNTSIYLQTLQTAQEETNIITKKKRCYNISTIGLFIERLFVFK